MHFARRPLSHQSAQNSHTSERNKSDTNCHVLMLFITSAVTGKHSSSVSPDKMQKVKSYNFCLLSNTQVASRFMSKTGTSTTETNLMHSFFPFFFSFTLGDLHFANILISIIIICLFWFMRKAMRLIIIQTSRQQVTSSTWARWWDAPVDMTCVFQQASRSTILFEPSILN